MNRKARFLAAALLAAGITTVNADVKVFGHIDTSLDATDQDGGSDDINLNCTTCSVGFKGSEDLGNGLKAIFKIDFQYDISKRNRASSGTNSLFDRDQWLGLAGSYGQVRIGTISTGYKSHGAKLDPFYRTALQGRGTRARGGGSLQSNLHSGAGQEGQGRATNTIRYDSPNWQGVNVVAHFTLDQTEADGEDNNPYGIGASYSNGGMLVFADYITNDMGGNDDAWKIGGKYSVDIFNFAAQYENDGGLISSKAAANPTDGRDLWFVSADVTLFGVKAYVGYGQGAESNGAGGTGDYEAVTIAAMHEMSKRTSLYAGFNAVDCDSAGGTACALRGENEIVSFGLKHKF